MSSAYGQCELSRETFPFSPDGAKRMIASPSNDLGRRSQGVPTGLFDEGYRPAIPPIAGRSDIQPINNTG
jgi:hypothetical protein